MATPSEAGDPGRAPDEPVPGDVPKSFGNISERHWSRARAGTNEEALEYYRSRSRAPGVAAGGAERNYYCMECEGVIAFDWQGEHCPHCNTALSGMAKRYFNWVEINEPAASDFRALLPFLLGGLVVLAGVLAIALWVFRG